MRKVLLCVFLLLTTAPMWGQTNTGVITGIVTDQAGAVIPGAKATITSQSTNVSLSFSTNSDGYFTSVPINPDTYSVTVTASGFQSETQTGIVLRVQARVNVNFQMRVGQVSQRVVVTTAIPTIDTQTSSVAQVVSSQTITAMPLNGRNPMQLATLAMGVANLSPDATASNGNTGGNTGPNAVDFVANGTRGTLNNFLLDGIDNNSNDNGGAVIIQQPDALQEFNVQTSSYSAEFGRAGGAVINAVTKSGTNSYHGDVFEFFRNAVLNARNFFQSTGPKAPFKQNQWGGTLGGPIIKDKLFFFGDYQGTKIIDYRTDFSTVPSPAEITGDFSASNFGTIYDPDTYNAATNTRESFAQEYGNGNVIPSSRIDPIAQAFAELYPAANLPGTVNNYTLTAASPYTLEQGDFRGDWDPSPKNQAFFRYTDEYTSSLSPARFPGEAQGQSGSELGQTTMGASLGETHLFSPSLFNVFRLGFNWYGNHQEYPPYGIHYPPADLTIPGITLRANTAGLAQFSPTGYTGVGMPGYSPTYLATEEREVADAVNIIRGKHSMVMGFEMRWTEFNIFQVPEPDGLLEFSGEYTQNPATGDGGDGMADALLGLTTVASYDTQVEVQNRQHVPAAYFEDDYRVTPTLTLNLGIRYDYFSPIVSKHNTQANFNYQTGQIEVAGQDGNSRGLVKVDKDNFSPRMGFAKTIAKKYVLSAGGGIFWTGQEIKTAAPEQLSYNLPFYYQPTFTSDGIDPSLITVSGGFPAASASQETDPGVTSLGGGPNDLGNYLSTPSYIEYNLSIQRSLPGQTSLQLSYVGSKGTHLQVWRDYNQDVTPGPGSVQSRRPWPNYGPFDAMPDEGGSKYYSGQMRLQKQSGQNLYLLSSFTWSKAYDTQPSVCCASPIPQNSWDIAAEQGLSDFSQTFRWVLSYDYLLPIGSGQRFASGIKPAVNQVIGGWHFGGIYSLGSGFLFSPQMGYDTSNTGSEGLLRPDQILPNGNLPRGQRSINNWFNTNAYAIPAEYTFGNAGRNTLIGPDQNDWDLALDKTFPIRESQNVQFRGEFFNVLNHPSFAQPDPALTDGPGAFGVVTGTAGANREIQFALKYNF